MGMLWNNVVNAVEECGNVLEQCGKCWNNVGNAMEECEKCCGRMW